MAVAGVPLQSIWERRARLDPRPHGVLAAEDPIPRQLDIRLRLPTQAGHLQGCTPRNRDAGEAGQEQGLISDNPMWCADHW